MKSKSRTEQDCFDQDWAEMLEESRLRPRATMTASLKLLRFTAILSSTRAQ
jgi:hypothetical protein